jgi:uncharacterized protein (DUF2336 family)
MGAPQSIIAELEEAIQSGSQDKRVETLRRVTDLFLSGADRLNDSQIAVFDDVLGLLIKRIESKAMIELSARLAPVDNAPSEVVRRLAWDDNIAIAEPVLAHSTRLTSDDLIGVAEAKGQQHLLAIAGRGELEEAITDVLVDRGDCAVKHRLAGNTGARFSENGFSTLVKNAENDEALTERIGLRIDLPIRLLKDLLLKATEAVRARLLAVARPETRAIIQQTLSKIAEEIDREVAAPRDFRLAVATINLMQQEGSLNEAAVYKFASERRYEEMVAAIGALCSTSVDLILPLVKSARIDGLLVACKAAGLRWPTVRAVLQRRISSHTMPAAALSGAEADYLKLSETSAQRTLRFWKVRVGSV